MRRLITASVLLAFGLAGCAADKEFEKEILGHPAPEAPSDTSWSRTPPPPPPAPTYAPPPSPAYAPPPPPAYAPAPPAPAYAPAPSPAYAPAQAQTPAPPVAGVAPARTQPAGSQTFTPKPFTPAPVAPEAPAAAQEPAASPAPAPTPAAPAPQAAPSPPAGPAAAGDRAVFTFQVGNFAHAEKAKELMTALENRGFGARMEPGKLNNKAFYRVFAVKEGSRAELEGELLAVGVTEPRLAEERPAGSAQGTKPVPVPGKKPAAAPAPQAAPEAVPPGKVRYAPPVVEPAPPLPDGYVPPPKKTGS